MSDIIPVIRRRPPPSAKPPALHSPIDAARSASAPSSTPADAPPDYEVGRGRPPIATRFGQEGGNRSGRKRKKRNDSLDDAIARQLGRRHKVREGGREKEISGIELLAATLFKGAVSGNSGATKVVIEAALRAASNAREAAPGPDAPIMSDADREMIEALLALANAADPAGQGASHG